MTSENTEIKLGDTPQVLYKYADWDKDYHKKLITSPEIYFSSPADFNDPYDCTVKPRYDLWSKEDWVEFYFNGFKKEYSDRKEEDLLNAANEFYIHIHEFEVNHENELNRITNSQNSHFTNNIGIFSLSEMKDNLLMWSHYANSHRGVCIGYNANLLKNHVIKTISPTDKIIRIFKCKYNSIHPEKKASTEIGNPIDYFNRLEIKYIGWEYEQEWRLTVNQNEPFNQRTIYLPIDVIKEIYLGLRISKANTSNILFELKKQNYNGKIFKAEQDEYEFKLNFTELTI